MDERFVKKCDDPLQFDKIRYMVHSLDTDTMHQIILEMCEVNPYLAVLCYVTSEQNFYLRTAIIDLLDTIKIDNLHIAIMLCSAFDVIYFSKPFFQKRQPHSKRNIPKSKINPRKKLYELMNLIIPSKNEQKRFTIDQWNQEPVYWIDNLFRCMLRNRFSRTQLFLKTIDNSSLDVNDYSEEIMISGNFSLITKKRNQIVKPKNQELLYWLRHIDNFGLYGKLELLQFNFETDYNHVINLMQTDSTKFLKYTIEPIIKLTAIGLLRKQLSIEIVKSLVKSSKNDFKPLFNELLISYTSLLNSEQYHAHIPSPFIPYWDEEKNGFPPFFRKGSFPFFKFWWKCTCGYSWQAPLKHRTLICPKCNNTISSKKTKRKQKGKQAPLNTQLMSPTQSNDNTTVLDIVKISSFPQKILNFFKRFI